MMFGAADGKQTMVVFRALTEVGSPEPVVAIFPAKGYSVRSGYCMVLWGKVWTQHKYSRMIEGSRQAAKEEYIELKHWLETESVMTQRGLIGMDLAIRQRKPTKAYLDKWLRDGNR